MNILCDNNNRVIKNNKQFHTDQDDMMHRIKTVLDEGKVNIVFKDLKKIFL